MYNYSFVTVYTGEKRSIINYVYINAFKDLPSIVLSHVCFWYLFFNLFCMALASVKKKKKNTSVVLAK
jgi:hypothetical protein